MNNRYLKDVRDALERAGLKQRYLTTNPYVPLAIGCAAGVVIGAGIALLVSPMSGRETRARLSGKARELTGQAKRIGSDASHRMQRAGGELREGFEQAQQQMQQPSETYGQEVIR